MADEEEDAAIRRIAIKIRRQRYAGISICGLLVFSLFHLSWHAQAQIGMWVLYGVFFVIVLMAFLILLNSWVEQLTSINLYRKYYLKEKFPVDKGE